MKWFYLIGGICVMVTTLHHGYMLRPMPLSFGWVVLGIANTIAGGAGGGLIGRSIELFFGSGKK